MGTPTMNNSVLLIITGLNMGGAEVQVFNLAKELKQRGWNVHVMSMISPKHFVQELSDIGVSVHTLGMKPGIPSLASIFAGLRLVRSISPSVVHSHMYHANIFARVLNLLSLKQLYLICTAHNIDETEGSLFRYWLYRTTKQLADLNTNVSSVAFSHYIRKRLINKKHGLHVPNGISLPIRTVNSNHIRTLFPEVGSKFIWLAAGRLVPAKDYPNLISAVEKLSALGLDFCVLIAGEGPLQRYLAEEIGARGLGDYIRMIGLRRDLDLLMASTDAVVLSSAWEGLPMVLLEALSYGKPIVATDVGGVSEIVGEHSGGEIVPKSDANKLAEAMRQIMIEPASLRLVRNQRARHIAAQFDIKSITSQWEGIYSRADTYRIPQ